MQCYKKNYPRPQFVRDQWIDLNGTWEFCFDDTKEGIKKGWTEKLPNPMQIQVPFTYETKLSGIGDESVHECVWYGKTIQISKQQNSDYKLILHFEGSDFETMVWMNGHFVGKHLGGYSRFSFDVSNHLNEGDNYISVKVVDFLDPQQPRGKQRWVKENFGCWYVQTTGIWKSVWMEYVPKYSISKVKMTPILRKRSVEFEYIIDQPIYDDDNKLEVEAVINYKGKNITQGRTMIRNNPTRVMIDLDLFNVENPWGIHLWSPDTPNLYDVTFNLFVNGIESDQVSSYFGMREIRIQGSQILLNNEPLYQRLILDQGYWNESHLTPPTEAAIIEDIEKIADLGYNG